MTKANHEFGLIVGDHFSTQGRGTTFWEIDAITDIRHVCQIITFVEIGGIIWMRVHVNDIHPRALTKWRTLNNLFPRPSMLPVWN